VVRHNDANPQSTPWNRLARARELIGSCRFRDALPVIEEFIAECPLEPEGYFWQGVALDGLNHTAEALAADMKGIGQVLRAGMDSAELRINAGNLMMKQGHFADALVQFKRAEQIDPELPLVQLNLGRNLTELGDSQAALSCFQRCEDMHFEPIQLSYYRAKALLKVGRRDDAREQVRRALSKLPEESAVTRKIKEEFAELLQKPK
jgi:tetratricopeptide (TPR) repeat protein